MEADCSAKVLLGQVSVAAATAAAVMVMLAADVEGENLGSSEAAGLVEAVVVAVVAVTAAAEAAAEATDAAAAAVDSVAVARWAVVKEDRTFCGRAESFPRRRWVEPGGHHTARRLKRLALPWRRPDVRTR